MKLLRKELTIVRSMRDAIEIVNILKENGIKSRYSLNSRNSTWLGRGTTRTYFASIGVNDNYDTLYYIYVNKDDFDEAFYILRTKLNK